MNKLSEFINSKELEINYVHNKLNIVNLDNIVLLTETKIIIMKDNKIINIRGSNLSLLKLLDNEILIGGNIKIIEL